ncbi:signal recognition particle subunit SRP72-like [Oscarella lobularis]|uniref:signal recognition particle subunit SRP72-like n=1 Tax=Oscarella lobularis TaxID=121494 RepID=UPI0033134618
MTSAEGPTVAQLYSRLDAYGKNGDYATGFKIATQILRQSPDEAAAFHCKTVCLVHESKFREALKSISEHPKMSESLDLIKAYCHYRLSNLTEARSLLESARSSKSLARDELLCQVLYRLEEHDASLSLYQNLVKHSQDEYDNERESNLAAVLASACYAKPTGQFSASQLRSTTYELCFNKACLLLNQNQCESALEMSQMAEDLCRKALQEDPDVADEEIEDELGAIKVQSAYAYQQLGQTSKAAKLYGQVLKTKPDDASLVAVASNNVICLNKDRDLFDSTKKAKALLSKQLNQKLNARQRSAVFLNRCLLLLYTNQSDQLAKLVTSLDSNSELRCLIQAAQLHKDKKVTEAANLLQSYANQHGDRAVRVQLTLAQIHIAKGQIKEACDVLKGIRELQHKPGTVSCLVQLYSRLRDTASAGGVLTEAVAHWRSQKASSLPNYLVTLLQHLAAFNIKHGLSEEAAAALEELRREKPKDIHVLAKLIAAYSQFDTKQAEALSADLPPLSSRQSIDVDALEKAPIGVRHLRRPVATESKQEQSLLSQKKKKKKKKKGKLPKNYDSSVDPDPERWLPRRERSYYRKKGRSAAAAAAIGKGSQGAMPATSDVDFSKGSPSAKKPSQLTAQVPSPQASGSSSVRGAGQARKKQPAKKKKKGKGW